MAGVLLATNATCNACYLTATGNIGICRTGSCLCNRDAKSKVCFSSARFRPGLATLPETESGLALRSLGSGHTSMEQKNPANDLTRSSGCVSQYLRKPVRNWVMSVCSKARISFNIPALLACSCQLRRFAAWRTHSTKLAPPPGFTATTATSFAQAAHLLPETMAAGGGGWRKNVAS